MSPPRKIVPSKKVTPGVQRRSKKQKNKKPEPEEEPEPVLLPVEEEKHEEKQETWLDRLPKFVRGDEELHKKLSQERKERKKMKHFDYCMDELMSIIDVAFAERKAIKEFHDENGFNQKILEKKLKHIKYDFIDGKFYPKKVVEQPTEVNTVRTNFDANDLKTPDISYLLDLSDVDVHESFIELMRQTFNDRNFKFDANPKIDSIITSLSESMQPFANPAKSPERVSLPFVICIAGPPCTGKSTIAQFIKRFFKVNVIEVINNENEETNYDPSVFKTAPNDEKKVFTAIDETLEQTEEGMGIVICNYPNSKVQLSALDKHLAAMAKQKGGSLPNVSVVFRTTMTQEEAEKAMEGRQIDSSTGHIYNKEFNTPNAIVLSKNPTFVNPKSEFTNYQKILTTTNTLDSFSKKGTIVIQVGKLEDIDQLEIQIENALRQAFDSHSIPVSFTSFVGIEQKSVLVYAKQCYDIFHLWNDTYIAQFGQGLSDMFARAKKIKSKIQYLVSVAEDKFSLILTQPDNRAKQSIELRSAQLYFDTMWDMTIKERDERLKDLDTVIEKSGLTHLKEALEKDICLVVDSIFLRMFISSWFLTELGSLPKEKILEQLPNIIIPMFDAEDIIHNGHKIGYSDFMTESVNNIDQMHDLLNYIKKNCTDEFKKNEADICLRMFDYLLETKAEIDKTIDENLESMKNKMAGWAQNRYCKEMESFSQRFIDVNSLPADEPIFVNVKDFTDKEHEDLVNRLGYRFSPNKPLAIEEKKLLRLTEIMRENTVASIEQFLEAADSCNFTQEEKDELEALIIMATVPGFIDVHSFILAISPDLEISAKIEELFK